jgi:surfeit locus 1 family protein
MTARPRRSLWVWIIATIVVIAGVGVLFRLGLWQLDRLEWRRAFNERVMTQMNQPPLDLNIEIPTNGLYDMEYRPVAVRGVYDHSQEVLLRNHVWENQLGYRVLSPLVIEGDDRAVYVDRGWIPFEEAHDLSQFKEPGTVLVEGIIRRPQTRPDFGGVPDPTLAPGETRLTAFTIVNLERLQQQVDLALLPVYIQQAPDPAHTSLPYRSLQEIELSEGSHFGYALQWFAFAALLGIGYPVFVYRHIKGSEGDARIDNETIENQKEIS